MFCLGLNKKTGFMSVCGTCEDPCALRLRPDMKKKGMMMGKAGKGGMQLMAMVMKELQDVMEEIEQE